MSYRGVANALGINNPLIIASYIHKIRDGGVEGLLKPKGRPSNMIKKKKETKKKYQKYHLKNVIVSRN